MIKYILKPIYLNVFIKKVSASNNNPQSTLTQKIGVNEKSVHYKSMADLSKALLNELNNPSL